MPKIVDHDARKAELLGAVWRVIVRDGLEGATMRAIAAETGWSSGVLQHYFTGKRDIIISAHELAYERVAARIDRRIVALSGREALQVATVEALPLDQERLDEARIEISAWNLAMADEDFRQVRLNSLQRWRESLEKLVTLGIEDGSIVRPVEIELAVHEVIAFVDAMSVEAILFPDYASSARQLELAERLLDRLFGPRRR